MQTVSLELELIPRRASMDPPRLSDVLHRQDILHQDVLHRQDVLQQDVLHQDVLHQDIHHRHVLHQRDVVHQRDVLQHHEVSRDSRASASRSLEQDRMVQGSEEELFPAQPVSSPMVLADRAAMVPQWLSSYYPLVL